MKKLLLSCIVALFFALPVYAVEFTSGDFKANIFGNLFIDGFYTYSSDNFSPIFSSLRIGDGQHSFGSYAFVGSSNFGVTMSYNNVSGTIEAGLGDPVRKFYLKYNIGGANDHYILAGRDNNIAFYNYGQLSNDGQSLIDYGTLNNRRRLQLRYGIKGFEVAVIIPQLGLVNADTDMAYRDEWTAKGENDKTLFGINSSDYMFNYLPRLELAYTLKGYGFSLKFFGSYGAYYYINDSADTITTEEGEYTIDEFDTVAHMWYIGFGGNANFGDSFINYVAYFGQNMYLNNAQGDYLADNKFLNPIFLKQTNSGGYVVDVENVYSAGGSIGYGYNALGGRLIPQIGIGYSVSFADHYSYTDQNLGAFVNLQYFINDWFSIAPEVALLHNLNGSDTKDQGFSIVAGIMAILSF